MKKLLLLFLSLALGAGTARAERTFGLADDYLNYGAGARALAMGGAAAGLADDASAEYANPGALAFVDEYQLLTMYAPFTLDTSLYYASVVLPFGPAGGAAV